MNHNLRWTNFVVVLSYRGLMAAIGMLLSRLQSTMENFFVAKRAIPACTHLGNIVVRTGRKVKYESKAKSIPGDTEANQFPGWQYRNHWFAPKL